MYETKVLKQFEKMPVFSLSDVNQIIENKLYAKKFLKRMIKERKIYRIIKNKYTLHNDAFLVSTFIKKPSYITSASALSYHKLITQIPNEIFCATMNKSQTISFTSKINFFHTNYFSGFKNYEYENFKIPIADPEKAIIDSFFIIPVSVFEEAFSEIDYENMIKHLKKIKKSSIIKRVGYLMEKTGQDTYKELKKYINYKYLPLDPLVRKKGKINRRWKLIINTK